MYGIGPYRTGQINHMIPLFQNPSIIDIGKKKEVLGDHL